MSDDREFSEFLDSVDPEDFRRAQLLAGDLEARTMIELAIGEVADLSRRLDRILSDDADA